MLELAFESDVLDLLIQTLPSREGVSSGEEDLHFVAVDFFPHCVIIAPWPLLLLRYPDLKGMKKKCHIAYLHIVQP